ncbi:hypothetical protein CPB83DRAFT_861782 [Crepidotus variabilis]|uniref:HRDC domain-containing protein n=1 Tax=Crepidotus variabilis TaxID=179855 RepID=A0A9P6JKW0_9AGAR|nr:hypothetical protein CPB83DRAFT_861782 [Crepidotus variabilis]
MAEGSSNLVAFDTLNANLQSSALNATRKSAALPADIGFHKSLDHDLAQSLDAVSERVLSVTNKLLSLVSTVDQTKGVQGKGKAKLQIRDDVVDNFQSLIVNSMDHLLENADICMDNLLGKNKAPAIATKLKPAEKTSVKKNPLQKPRNDIVIQHAAHLPKPQLSFKRVPDNTDAPWYPTLSHKYNAKVPLGHIYDDGSAGSSSSLVSNHPYRYEITHLNYPPRMYETSTPIPPLPLEESAAIWVSEPSQFQAMLAKLREATELAIDLEHHSYRSYAGFLCLMQISNREQDWIVDLLTLRGEVEVLNEVFTDPSIVKVFHGAESDIVWLQQDFNVYVVNIFDTYHASKLLDFPRHGLSNLLEMYCDFTPDKRYQLADWRIRPLPEDMLQYARSDTHFLLFIYDNLRNALLDKSKSLSGSPIGSPLPHSTLTGSIMATIKSNSPSAKTTSLLDETLARSAETSLRVYTKEPYDTSEGSGPGGWDTLAKRWNKIALTSGGPGVGVGSMQREVYKSVHWWREKVAREEDESTRYILQNHLLFLIAEQPPADITSLLRIFRSSVPPVIKRRAKELLSVIKEAVKRGLPLEQPVDTEKPMTQQLVSLTDELVSKVGSETDDLAVEKSLNIWGASAVRVATTAHSTLFGPVKSHSQSLPTTSQVSASISTLFGQKSSSPIAAHGLRPTTSPPKFQGIVSKINQSLVLLPTLPQVLTVASKHAIPSNSFPRVLDPASGMQIDVEIPYAPPSQRPTKQEAFKQEEPDSIVVVGQSRQKRKRKSLNSRPQQNGSEKVEESVQPFDFSTAPNILDSSIEYNEGQDDSNKRRKKKRANKVSGPFYGDFPAPPKAHNEVRSGNQSFTFTK